MEPCKLDNVRLITFLRFARATKRFSQRFSWPLVEFGLRIGPNREGLNLAQLRLAALKVNITVAAQGGICNHFYVCPVVCLSVCLSVCEQNDARKSQAIFIKPCRIMDYCCGKNRLNFGFDSIHSGRVEAIFVFLQWWRHLANSLKISYFYLHCTFTRYLGEKCVVSCLAQVCRLPRVYQSGNKFSSRSIARKFTRQQHCSVKRLERMKCCNVWRLQSFQRTAAYMPSVGTWRRSTLQRLRCQEWHRCAVSTSAASSRHSSPAQGGNLRQ